MNCILAGNNYSIIIFYFLIIISSTKKVHFLWDEASFVINAIELLSLLTKIVVFHHIIDHYHSIDFINPMTNCEEWVYIAVV